MQQPGSANSLKKATSRRAMSMSGQLSMFEPTNSPDIPKSTSLPASEAGLLPSAEPDGATTIPFGPALAPASRSPLPAGAKASTTTVTSGPSSEPSSPSDALQQSLESRLRALLTGSDLCEVIWKPWNTPWGQCLSRPRARVRTTSGTDFGSWLTPHCPRANDSDNTAGRFYPTKKQNDLAAQATWATPAARDWRSDRSQKSSEEMYGTKGRPLPRQVLEASPWPTPTSLSGGSETSNPPGNSRNLNKIREHALALYPTARANKWGPPDSHGNVSAWSGPSEQTEKRGALNPEFVCWLMGFPAVWVSCGVSAMQSIRAPRRRSSKQQPV